MRHRYIMLALLIAGCPKPPHQPEIESGFTDGPTPPPPPDEPEPPPPVVECPGETQCPCTLPRVDDTGAPLDGCPDPLLCGPAGACTRWCSDNSECNSGASGELCLGDPGRCAIVCDPSYPHGGCPVIAGQQAECREILNTYVCGFSP